MNGRGTCLGFYGPRPSNSDRNDTWIENTCTLYRSSTPYQIDKCDTAHLFVPYLANNTIYIPSGTEVGFNCSVNGTVVRLNLQQWQSHGLDIGTIVETTPDVQTIIEWGRKMLQGSM